MEARRIDPEQARRLIDSSNAVLVCAYDDERCRQYGLPGAIALTEFEQQAASLPKDRQIIFYCA